MSGLHPTARLDLDGQVTTMAEAAAYRIRVDLGVGDAHDAAEVHVTTDSPLVDAAPGAQLTIELGERDDLVEVITGDVTTVATRVDSTVITALAPSYRLSHQRTGRAFVGDTAGDIAQSLLDLAEVDAGEVRAPQRLAIFHVDEGRSAWRHLRRLARLADCETSSDASGGLNFRAAKSGTRGDHRLAYGADLIAWSLATHGSTAPYAAAPYGAASEAGNDKWFVVHKDPTGGAPDEPTRLPAPIRDRDSAGEIGTGWSSRSERAELGGHLLTLGRAAIRAGDLIELVDVDDSPLPTVVRALEVQHRFDGHRGFTTAIRIGGPSSGGLP
ncbi:MAG: hypothetical protein AAGD38_03185 [Acidobacteriota bacterium]